MGLQRSHQRFGQFQKAFRLLERAVQQNALSELEEAGLIQFFEMTLELAWKVMKDYLENEGMSPKTPRQSIKMAFQADILDNAQVWIDALDDRNLTSHTYNEHTAKQVVQLIKSKYYPMLADLHNTMENVK